MLTWTSSRVGQFAFDDDEAARVPEGGRLRDRRRPGPVAVDAPVASVFGLELRMIEVDRVARFDRCIPQLRLVLFDAEDEVAFSCRRRALPLSSGCASRQR
ncbi:MAG: hypothetical protein M0Z93_00125 [Actinomycetota bacterium]|jgi:hypothetical protein|nr:hypothetical protein [Actinomycetota bacterium]